jgi:hypothetical protein
LGTAEQYGGTLDSASTFQLFVLEVCAVVRSESEFRIWQALSWLSVVVFLCFGIWWMLYLPTVGKGGLFLAAGAVLMPLFWEKIDVIGRMSWVAMLFLLLGVEYRAIDKEHHDNDDAQKKAPKTNRRWVYCRPY